MTAFFRAVSAEFLKLRRSLMFWIAIAAPVVVIVLVFIVGNAEFNRSAGSLARANPWNTMRSALLVWTILMLPLFLTLEAALSGALEHSSKQWKHLFALPVPRWTIYAAKAVSLLALGVVAVLTLWIGTLAGGFALHALHPGLASGPIGALDLLGASVFSFFAALFMLAIQLWISVTWPSFSLSIGIGILGTTASLIIASTNWSRGYPWSLPFQVVRPQGEHPVEAVVIGVAGAIVVTAIGCWTVTRRDVM